MPRQALLVEDTPQESADGVFGPDRLCGLRGLGGIGRGRAIRPTGRSAFRAEQPVQGPAAINLPESTGPDLLGDVPLHFVDVENPSRIVDRTDETHTDGRCVLMIREPGLRIDVHLPRWKVDHCGGLSRRCIRIQGDVRGPQNAARDRVRSAQRPEGCLAALQRTLSQVDEVGNAVQFAQSVRERTQIESLDRSVANIERARSRQGRHKIILRHSPCRQFGVVG